MSLDPTRLSLALVSAHVAAGATAGAALTLLCNGLASAIITELTTHGEVLPTGTPPMSNSGGSVTGKGVIT